MSKGSQTGKVLCPAGIAALALTLLLAGTSVVQAQSSILIAGGTVIDGTGAPGRAADVRVVGTTIREIGRLKAKSGERVIDAHGLVVSPGFIDTHSHADGGLLEDTAAETQIRQGITTSVVGQDGSSHLPLADWFAQVEKTHTALNIASFVGHGTIREKILGENYKHAATTDELQKMEALVADEMKSGGLGLSSGLEYDPGFYSNTEELIGCAKVAGRYGGIYISHVRDEGNEAFKAFDELIRIGEEGLLPAQISHIKLDTSPAWGRAGQVLASMESAAKRGVDVSADVYPYLYWQSTITVLIPTRDWDNRAIWEKGLAEVGGPEHVLLTTYSGDSAWRGKTIAEIAAMTGRDAISVIQEIVHTTHGAAGKEGQESVVVTAMTEDDLRAFLKSPRIMFCTDGGLHGTHPRGAGSYPRILGLYVRELHVLTLEQAIHKAAGLPARRMGFVDRGILRRGNRADIVVFDPAQIRDTATTANAQSAPVGLPYVLVNGSVVLDNGTMTSARPGAVLRRTRSINRPL